MFHIKVYMHHRAQWRYQSRNFEEAQLKERALHGTRASLCAWFGTFMKWKEKMEIKPSMNMKTFADFFPLFPLLWVRCSENPLPKKDWTMNGTLHVMGPPKRNCFQFEAGQVKIKSIAELKTFHISFCACSMTFTVFPPSNSHSSPFRFHRFFSFCVRVDDRTLNVL